jgi:hypothetical protein
MTIPEIDIGTSAWHYFDHQNQCLALLRSSEPVPGTDSDIRRIDTAIWKKGGKPHGENGA